MHERSIPSPRYNVGDCVTISDVTKCAWGYSRDMMKYIGKDATISVSVWSSSKKQYAYRIKEDQQMWWYDDSCFEPIKEFEIESEQSLMNFLLS